MGDMVEFYLPKCIINFNTHNSSTRHISLLILAPREKEAGEIYRDKIMHTDEDARTRFEFLYSAGKTGTLATYIHTIPDFFALNNKVKTCYLFYAGLCSNTNIFSFHPGIKPNREL